MKEERWIEVGEGRRWNNVARNSALTGRLFRSKQRVSSRSLLKVGVNPSHGI